MITESDYLQVTTLAKLNSRSANAFKWSVSHSIRPSIHPYIFTHVLSLKERSHQISSHLISSELN